MLMNTVIKPIFLTMEEYYLHSYPTNAASVIMIIVDKVTCLFYTSSKGGNV
jgi:hypothetical protein